jgi:hypothetical protein
MRFLILALSIAAFGLSVAEERVRWSHAQGEGYYPLVVRVEELGSDKPISGAKVHMRDDQRPLPTISSEPWVTVRDAFYDTRQCDRAGLTSLYYAARWSEYSSGAHFRSIRGILIVEAKGFEPLEIDLQKWQAENGYSAERSAALAVTATLKPKGEQGGADQPATAPQLKSEDIENPNPESEGRPQ